MANNWCIQNVKSCMIWERAIDCQKLLLFQMKFYDIFLLRTFCTSNYNLDFYQEKFQSSLNLKKLRVRATELVFVENFLTLCKKQ